MCLSAVSWGGVGGGGVGGFFFQAEDGIRDLVRSRGLGDVYKRQAIVQGGIIPRNGSYKQTFQKCIGGGKPAGPLGSEGRCNHTN